MGISNLKRTSWLVTWGALDLGLLDEVSPDLKIMHDPIMTGTTGKIILGHRIIGLEGSISVVIRETTLGVLKAMCPWWSTGLVPVVPTAFNVDSYSYAALLKCHPSHLPTATVGEDLNLLKTVPLTPMSIKRGGTKDDEWKVEFQVYPDRAFLEAVPPTLVYGYIGAAA